MLFLNNNLLLIMISNSISIRTFSTRSINLASWSGRAARASPARGRRERSGRQPNGCLVYSRKQFRHVCKL